MRITFQSIFGDKPRHESNRLLQKKFKKLSFYCQKNGSSEPPPFKDESVLMNHIMENCVS